MRDCLRLGRSCAGSAAAGLVAIVAAWSVSAGSAHADDNPKNIACVFASGASQSYTEGAFKSKSSTPLSFSIADVDLEKQTAALKVTADADPGKLSVVRAINANHYLEVVNEGFLNITTVYDKDEKTGKYPAVHSRHGGVLGSPVFGQYTGFCSEE